ncbi:MULTISPECIES: hypothetical protein [unclassified Streptomyces]
MITTTLAAFTEPDRPQKLLIRFITVGGSYVDANNYAASCRAIPLR